MTVPDYISPVVACRVWFWNDAGLRSLNGEPWIAGQPLAACCRAASAKMSAGGAEAAYRGHDVPAANCTCGIYAAKTLSHLRWAGYTQYGIHGEVYLWGTVVEHALGWRAQYAYPKSLVLPLDTMPISMAAVEARLAALGRYGCELSVAGKQTMVPLWSKDCGFNAAGLDLLLLRSQSWYARREQERQIRRRDRVAIIGGGIALIEHVDEQYVHVLLWNQSVLRIGRREITWHAGNMRWEAKPQGYIRGNVLVDSFGRVESHKRKQEMDCIAQQGEEIGL